MNTGELEALQIEVARLRNENAALRSLQLMADNIPVGLLVWQFSGEKRALIGCNAAAELFLDTALKPRLGSRADEICASHSPEAVGIEYALVSGTVTVFPDPLRVNGRWMQLTAIPLVSSIVALVYLDVTRQVDIQLDLARSNSELESFAYIASHDLQEPLRMVSSYLSLLNEDLESKLDTETREYMNFALDGAKRMQRLINDLLAYSRVGRSPDFKLQSLDAVLDDTLLVLEPLIKERGAVVERGRLGDAWFDRSSISRVLTNLIGNAIKFRQESVAPLVRVTSEESSHGSVIVVVEDNGVGFDPKYQDRIFEIFQRLTTDKNGTGIGLAVCKKVVQQHGGSIWASSIPGVGSKFYFDLRKLPPSGPS